MVKPLIRLGSSLPGFVFMLHAMAASAPVPQLAAPRILQGISPQIRSTMVGNTSAYLTSGQDTGALADDENLENMLLQLQRSPERERALQDMIEQMHTPDSPNFHHWLSNEQLFTQYGPAQQDIDTITSWLASNGFTVNSVNPTGMQIDFSGSAGQVKRAFATTLHRYKLNGKVYLSNASDPSIPAALAPVVLGVVSLNNLFPQPQLHAPITAAKSTPTWNPEFTVGTGTRYLVAPYDFNTIYNVGPVWSAGITGAGQTIVVIENTNILNASDVTTFRDAFGIGSKAGYSGVFSQVHPSGGTACKDPGVTANEREAALDAEWAGVAAPNANIELASCQDTGVTFGGLIAANNIIASTNPPTIMSVSYGVCENQNGATANAAYVTAWQTAAAKGISVFVAAGDEGATSCDAGGSYGTQGLSVSGFASTPYNVAVGGTDFRDSVDGTAATYWNSSNGAGLSTAKSYIPEIPWNNSCASGILYTFRGYADGVTFCNSTTAYNSGFVTTVSGSGGASNYSAKPSWQSGVVGIANDGKRDIPDVSLFAANGIFGHSMLYCMSDSAHGGMTCDYTNTSDTLHNVGGGTSFSAPALAGIQALVNQATGQSWGNMNTRYYALAAQQYGSAASPNSANLNSCNANNGNGIGSNCVFQDITSGDIDVPCMYGSTNCYSNYTGAANDNCNDYSTTPAKTSTCGVISTSISSALSAYAATPGWDFATGLGSVNVANLVAAMLPPPVASKLKFTTQPTNGAAGSALATIKVSVESSSGYVVTANTAAITLAFANNAGGATLGGTLTVNAINGVATFNNIAINKLGSGYTLSASTANLTSDTSSAFAISPGAAAKLVYLQQPSNATAGSALSPAITLQVQDINGNAVTSSAAPIVLSIGNNPGTATLSGGTATASGGIATFNNVALDKTGVGYTLIASSNGLNSTTSSAFNIVPGVAASLVYTSQPPQSSSSDATFTAIVSVRDANGNIVTSDASSVTLALSGNFGAAAFAPDKSTVTASAVKGVATFSNLSVLKAGSNYTLTATDANLASATSTTFQITPGAATKLVYASAPPANVYSGVNFAATVSVQDSNGNVVTGNTSAVALALSAGANNASLSGTTTINAVNGVASFSDLAVDKVGSGYALTATQASLSSASSNFNVTPGMASRIVFVQQPANSTAGSTLAMTVQVLDANGNPVTTDSSSITLALANNPGGSTLSGSTTATASNGIATFDAVSLNKTGSAYALTASDGNLTAATSTGFEISAGAAAQLVFATQPADIRQDQTLGDVTVTLLDAFQNIVSNDNSSVITLTIPSCNGTTLATQTVTNGVATLAGDSPLRTATSSLQLTATAMQPSISATSESFAVLANPDKVFFNAFEACTP